MTLYTFDREQNENKVRVVTILFQPALPIPILWVSLSGVAAARVTNCWHSFPEMDHAWPGKLQGVWPDNYLLVWGHLGGRGGLSSLVEN